MVRSDFEISQSLIDENKIASNVSFSIALQMCLFGNLIVILVSSNNPWKTVRIARGSEDVAIRFCQKYLQIEQPFTFKGRGCGNEILEGGIKPLKNGFNQLNLHSSNFIKMKFFIKDFFCKCEQIRRKLIQIIKNVLK